MNSKIYFFSLYLLVLTVFFADWLSDSLGLMPRPFTWLSDLMIMFLAAAALKESVFKKIRDFKYSWFIVTLSGLVLLSFILNHQSPAILIAIGHKYLKYPIMGLALFSLSLKLDIYKNIYKILTAIILIQLPVVYFQRIYFASFSKLEYIEDAAGGTLGRTSTDILSCACAIFIILFLKNFFSSKKKIYLALILLMYLPAIYGSVKFSFLFYPFIIIFMAGLYFYGQRVRLRRKFLKLSLVFILVSAINLLFMIWHDQVAQKPILINWAKNPSLIVDYELEIIRKDDVGFAKRKGRFGPFITAYLLFKENPQNIIFGFGGCSTSESFLKGRFSGQLYKKGVLIYKPSFVKILVEFGILGLLVYLVLLFKICIEGVKNKNYLLFGLGLVLLGMSIYTATWDHEIAGFLFWFILAADLSYKEISLD